MKKTAIIPVLLVTLLVSAGPSFAWPGSQGKKNCDNSCNRQGQEMRYDQREDRLEKMAVILDLTEKQQQQIKDLTEKQRQDRQTMRAKMQANRDEIRAYKQGKEFSEDEFRAKAQKLADVKVEMMVQQAKSRQEIFAVLTPEQQQKAEKLRAIHGDGFFGKKHGKCGDCDGPERRGAKGHGQRCNG